MMFLMVIFRDKVEEIRVHDQEEGELVA